MQSFYLKPENLPLEPIQYTLGIETSCDETAIALYDCRRGLLAHTLYSQIEVHNQYGGVVPELASRDHILKILPLIQQTLQEAGLERSSIGGVAYCAGPGLAGALLVGAVLGRSLGWALSVPTLGVHHIEAHLLAPMLEAEKPSFPFLALLVSGGHTHLAEVKGLGDYALLGETLDDAAGEAFDKTAKLLKLPYPGGPAIAQLAQKSRTERFHFPRPMLDRPGLDFSFSGLKTAVNTLVKTTDHLDEQTRADIAAAFQTAVVETLVRKTERALRQTGLKRLVLAGGVAANQALRIEMDKMAKNQGVSLYYPRPSFCTDNGAMIAYLGSLRLNLGYCDPPFTIRTITRWPLDQLF